MARVMTLTDDTDDSPGAIERRFTIDGVEYQIDLTDENYAQLLEHMSFYLERARPVRERKSKRENRAPIVNPEDRDKIRAWAIAHGRPISSVGRFPADVIRDYYATMERLSTNYVLS